MNENTTNNSQPWYPEPHPHFGPWIDHDDATMPEDCSILVQWMSYEEQYRKVWNATVYRADKINWDNPNMVAYRVKLIANR